MKEQAAVIQTKDTKYKNGSVECAVCGWKKDLGDGFNQYQIDCCPKCDPELRTRSQRKVTTGKPSNLTVKIGNFVYFVLSNGIHCQYSGQVWSTHSGLTEKQADRL